MKIYTRSGDDGTTGLFGGQRVAKHDLRVEAYGTLDELNSFIGLARSFELPSDVDDVLGGVQHELFVVCAEIACVPGKEQDLNLPLVDDQSVRRLESAIDESDKQLPPLKQFILPGGSKGASALHVARTVARRAERTLLAARASGRVRPLIVAYINRLSDLLFVLARRANHASGGNDVIWNQSSR